MAPIFHLASANTESTVIMITCVIFLALFLVAGIKSLKKQFKNK